MQEAGPIAHRQLILENKVLLACPHCWTRQEIAEAYPELLKYPVSDRLCAFHFQFVLASTMSKLGWVQDSPPPAQESSPSPRSG